MSSNNHFADPSLISFAELQQLVWDNDTLSFPRRREIASAINTSCCLVQLAAGHDPCINKLPS